MVKLDNFDGHIVFYCKNHYGSDKTEFFDGLKRIWAVRCGLEPEHVNQDVFQYIANHMHKILADCNQHTIEYYQNGLHRALVSPSFVTFEPQGLTPIEKVIWYYRSEILKLRIRETKPDGRIIILVKLPSPKKRILNRIVDGGGKFEDYELIEKKK